MRIQLLCSFLMIAVFCAAQPVFEGTITYVVKERGQTQATLTVYFGKKAIRATFADEKGMDKEQLLYLVDSNMIAQINMVDKTYRPKYYPAPQLPDAQTLVISGHPAKAVAAYGVRGNSGFLSGAMYYVADDLFYPVPPHMALADELIMISNNHVVLGFTMSDQPGYKMTSFDSAFNDADFRGAIAKAVKIETAVPDASIFTIGAEYARLPSHDEMSEVYADDSITTVIDSVAYDPVVVEEEPVVATPPKVVKPAKKPTKAPSKKPAAKKVPAPARKPE